MSESSAPQANQPPVFTPRGGMALIVVGLLILVPSGLCTSVVGFLFVQDMVVSGNTSAGDVMTILPVLLLFGGIPIAVGALLLWIGLRKRRAGRTAADG